MRTAEEAALLLALLLTRSEQTRARVSEKTIRKVSGRRHIRSAFVGMLMDHLADLGINMSELERGGYGLLRSSVLEGAPAITAKTHLADKLKGRKPINFDDIRKEVAADVESEPDDED